MPEKYPLKLICKVNASEYSGKLRMHYTKSIILNEEEEK